MPKIPYLGKLLLKWCPSCNVPIVKADFCSKCASPTFSVNISVPGDFRPAFKGDLIRLREVIKKDFGADFSGELIPEDKIIVLNKVPGLDFVEEVVVDGRILGTLFFDPFTDDFHFSLKYDGGLRLYYYARVKAIPLPKFIQYSEDGVPFLLSGKSIVAPAIETLSDDLKKKERCNLICKKGYIGIGLVAQELKDIRELMENKRGLIAKPKEVKPPVDIGDISIPKGGQTMSAVFSANKTHLDSIVKKAKQFITKTIDQFSNLKVSVAYSGGKDSLCTLLLVYEVLGPNFLIFFADTGIEFPEVLEHTKLTIDLLGMRDHFHQRSAGNKFWELVEKFGPPARDFRYCCHSLKAQQINSLIEEIAGNEKIVVFLGQRRYESFSRAQDRMIYTNSYIPSQISATPIKNWTAFEVWLFLLPYTINGKSFPLNDLYFRGHERLGCYLCPSINLATRSVMRDTHPDLITRWESYLTTYAKKMGLPQEWVTLGLWRSKKLNKLWNNIVEELEIDLKPKSNNTNTQSFCVTAGYAPCTKGGYSLKGKFEGPIDLQKIETYMLSLPGIIKIHEKQGLMNIRNDEIQADIFADGSVYVRFLDNSKDYQDIVYLIVGIIARSYACTSCGVCAQVCPTKSLQVENQHIIFNPKTCIHCKKCTLQCPIFKLTSREIQWEESEIL